MRRVTLYALTLFVLAACGTDSGATTEPRFPQAPALAKSGGGGNNTLYAYSLSGDVTGAGGTATKPTTSPFQNLTVSGVTVTFSGSPTGTISACRTGTATYVDHFGGNAGRAFTGTITIPKTGAMSFNGTEVGGTATVQFSTGDATPGPVQTAHPDGSYTLALTDARFFFGGNSTYFDGLYRCVNITVTATPAA